MPQSFANTTACVFDAYGTLFDLKSATDRLSADLGDKAPVLGDLWRRKQLEYTWLRSMMGEWADFWQVTGDSLDYALEQLKIDDPDLRDRLLAQFEGLDAYPDVRPALEALRAAGFKTAILSNGTPKMLELGTASAGIGDVLDALLSVDTVRVNKPSWKVYKMACDHFGIVPQNVCFVSSNGWDAYAANHYGFQVAWLNRAGNAAERIPGKPGAVITDLRDLLTLLDKD